MAAPLIAEYAPGLRGARSQGTQSLCLESPAREAAIEPSHIGGRGEPSVVDQAIAFGNEAEADEAVGRSRRKKNNFRFSPNVNY
jgi:hypothetical protein